MTYPEKVIYVASLCLAAVIVSMIGMFIYAILDPSVDDALVFQIVGPAFQNIVGVFSGLIAGIKIGQNNDTTE